MWPRKECSFEIFLAFLQLFSFVFFYTISLSSIAVTCPAMTVKSEGLIVSPSACVNSSASLRYAAECRFTCKKGYQLAGPGLKTCAQNKKWFPIGNPSCRGLSQSWYLSDLKNDVMPFFSGPLLSLIKEQDDVVIYNEAIEDFFCLSSYANPRHSGLHNCCMMSQACQHTLI